MKIIQIGGGNKIENSQGQIEDNVVWLSRILNRSSNDVVNYFASGLGEEKDVSLYREPDDEGLMEPLARVFEGGDISLLAFRHNRVPELSGSMRKEEIQESLSATLKQVKEKQDVLLVFNGHGGIDEENVKQNSIKIWGDEKLKVSEMDAILDSAPQENTIRFVFPQCFSGGFYSLIYESLETNEISKQNRCGFFAESPHEMSEGCSLSTNKDEYRDYSTYFFAPLNGSTRLDEPLPLDADFDQNGEVTFHESHVYAVMVGESKDLSRSTSEMYLENWVPWYLRWNYGNEDKSSLYWKIAEYLSAKHAIPLDGDVLARLKKQMHARVDKSIEDQESAESDIEKRSEEIRMDLKKAWPELFHPYTDSYINLINRMGDEINQFIKQHPGYESLVRSQTELEESQARQLKSEREEAQVDKILRMKNLARIKKSFDIFATKREKEIYARLRECENGVFFRK